MAVPSDSARESHYKILLQKIENVHDCMDDLIAETEELKSSLDVLLLERSEHQEQFFNKLKLKYNEAVLTRNVIYQMDLTLALSKAQEIYLKISSEISKKRKLIKVLSSEKDLLKQKLGQLTEDVRTFILANGVVSTKLNFGETQMRAYN